MSLEDCLARYTEYEQKTPSLFGKSREKRLPYHIHATELQKPSYRHLDAWKDYTLTPEEAQRDEKLCDSHTIMSTNPAGLLDGPLRNIGKLWLDTMLINLLHEWGDIPIYVVFGGNAWDLHLDTRDSFDWDLKIDLRTAEGGKLWKAIDDVLTQDLMEKFRILFSGEEIEMVKNIVPKHSTIRFCLQKKAQPATATCLVDLHPVWAPLAHDRIKGINVEKLPQLVADAKRVAAEAQNDIDNLTKQLRFWKSQFATKSITCEDLFHEGYLSTLRYLSSMQVRKQRLCNLKKKNLGRLTTPKSALYQ